jgi:hypothetical protein
VKKKIMNRASKLELELEKISGGVTLEEKILRGNYRVVVSDD